MTTERCWGCGATHDMDGQIFYQINFGRIQAVPCPWCYKMGKEKRDNVPHPMSVISLFKTVWIKTYGLTGIIVEVFPFGICRVSDRDGERWNEEFRIALFHKRQYPFLRKHIFRNWWIGNRKYLKSIPRNGDDSFSRIVS